MRLILIVLNKIELLETLLKKLAEEEISGATILNSTGMLRELSKNADVPIFGSWRFHINLERSESKTIFLALEEEKVEKAKAIIREVIGDISKPDTAVMFTLPILDVEGVEY
jgi:hypothetical protein